MREEGKYEKRLVLNTTTIHRMTLYAHLESKTRFYCLMLNQQQPHSIANMHSTTVGNMAWHVCAQGAYSFRKRFL